MSETGYKTVYKGGTGEIEEKKSRFIASIEPVTSEEEAVAFFNKKKKEYWDARHNCTAFTIGEKHENTRCSDDGEPSGTAGRPMLDVLLREDIHNVAVVVTRYFGGTLLGTGGLVFLITGGVAYTVGAVLYGLGKKRRYFHSIFHLFVLAGSILHFFCILLYIL